MEEIWKDIDEYKGIYQVSSLGRVRSLDRYDACKRFQTRMLKGQILKPLATKGGYFRVALMVTNNRKYCLIHRLVAKAFIANPDNHPCINHIDENKSNNSVANLEWCTYKYNNTYGVGAQQRIVSRRNSIKGKKAVGQYTKDGKLINTYKSICDAARSISHILKSPKSAIWSVCTGRKKSCAGYVWKLI